MRCTCANRIWSFFFYLYIELFELVIEVIFHCCTTPPCHKITLFKRPFRGSRFERLDDAFVLLVSLIFLYPQKILRKSSFLSDDRLNSWMYSVRWFSVLITMPSGLRFQTRFSWNIIVLTSGRCKTSSLGWSAGLLIPRASVRFRQKLKKSRTQI